MNPIKIFFLILLYLSFFIFLYFNANKISEGPMIIIKEKILENQILILKGEVKNSLNLTINGLESLIDENGNFASKILLKEGENLIIFESENNLKQKTKRILNVRFMN